MKKGVAAGPRKLDLGKDSTLSNDGQTDNVVKVFQLNGHKSKMCNVNIDLATKQL